MKNFHPVRIAKFLLLFLFNTIHFVFDPNASITITIYVFKSNARNHHDKNSHVKGSKLVHLAETISEFWFLFWAHFHESFVSKNEYKKF